MGAWGDGPFENDMAMDWLGEATEGDDVSAAVETALRSTIDASYLDADDGSVAVAAAAIVASTRDKNDAGLPEDATSLIVGWTPEPALVELAHQALSNVAGPKSELASLWGEGSSGSAWTEGLEALKKRLYSPANTP